MTAQEAASSERASFNRVNKKTGNRLKQQLVDAETGEAVDKEEIGRGYEIGKGQYPRSKIICKRNPSEQ
jgi:DNA end-binding protein Ku